jgi:hypothetical protein
MINDYCVIKKRAEKCRSSASRILFGEADDLVELAKPNQQAKPEN